MTDSPRTPYDALGEAGIRTLVDRFYDLMETRPDATTIRAMHASDLTPMKETLAVFLIGWMGGPSDYTKRFGSINVPLVHAPYAIGPGERDAWMPCMEQALTECDLPEALRDRVTTLFAQMAEMCRTRESDGSLRPQFSQPTR
jgi:hemoglobin